MTFFLNMHVKVCVFKNLFKAIHKSYPEEEAALKCCVWSGYCFFVCFWFVCFMAIFGMIHHIEPGDYRGDVHPVKTINSEKLLYGLNRH